MKDALTGRLKPSQDGLLHIYPQNSGNMTIDDYLKDLNDGTPPHLGGEQGADGNRLLMSQTATNPDMDPLEDRPMNGGVFRVTQPMDSNKFAEDDNQDDPPEEVSALNNIIHPLLNDQDNKLDEKLQTKILQEELGNPRGFPINPYSLRKGESSLKRQWQHIAFLFSISI